MSNVHANIDQFYNVELPKMDDDVKHEFIKKTALAYERDLLKFMSMRRVTKVYGIREYVTEEDRIECRLYFFTEEERKDALDTCRRTGEFTILHDFSNLVNMSDKEFQQLSGSPNFKYAKEYRDIMRLYNNRAESVKGKKDE